MMPLHVPQHTPRQSTLLGFTLIELLVAMVIFSMLAVAGWKVFDGLMRTRDRAAVQAQALMRLQTAYLMLQRDLIQASPRPARKGDDTLPALVLSSSQLEFSRSGIADPLHPGQSRMARIRYRLDNGTLIREDLGNPDQLDQVQPLTTVVLEGVTELNFTALNPETLTTWPSDSASIGDGPPPTEQGSSASGGTAKVFPQGITKLPRGIQCTLTLAGQPMQWTFALVKPLPAPTKTGS